MEVERNSSDDFVMVTTCGGVLGFDDDNDECEENDESKSLIDSSLSTQAGTDEEEPQGVAVERGEALLRELIGLEESESIRELWSSGSLSHCEGLESAGREVVVSCYEVGFLQALKKFRVKKTKHISGTSTIVALPPNAAGPSNTVIFFSLATLLCCPSLIFPVYVSFLVAALMANPVAAV
eukprot:TRINITY_DN6514_c1_g1_i1.p1 TRINITY_DN6514_c1_g1~~TRINITY_DN6514_c1_g1_i1.p1  ORF type:complete len:198 (+),score=24.19 TRINITY_DN6514_c1_g1_i1:52-594(+)